MNTSHPEVSAQTLIPDLLREHPLARQVLDKYGLKGCGGPEGPHESLRFFARAHEVDEHALLCEIERALQFESTQPNAPAVVPPTVDVADVIYRRFFIAGILVAVTFGATWGAWMLWKIGLGGSYHGVGVNEINAHGQAQIFGWMGLFIMGFAYQAFPRFWHSTLAAPRLAVASFCMMMFGIISASVGLAMSNSTPLALALGVGGSALELGALSVFFYEIFSTFRRSGKRLEPYIGYVFTALAWFIISSAYNVWHVWNTLTADPARLQWLVATFQPSLRDMQFYGVGVTLILGVSLRTLPHFYDTTKVPERRAWAVLALLTGAIVFAVVAGITGRLVHYRQLDLLMTVPWAITLVSSLLLVSSWKLWRPFQESDRSAKFIKTGYVWLVVSLLMLLGLPVYKTVTHVGSTHAWMAATHHAITVGFISLLIMGHAAKVVPTLNGIAPNRLKPLWVPFVLINIGCFLRVITQIMTDWSTLAFPIIGLSGTLEVIAIGWWGWGLISIIMEGKRQEQALLRGAPVVNSARPDLPLTGDEKVAAVLDAYPETVPIFVKNGFGAVTNPILRNTLARQVTIKTACKMHEVPEKEFVTSLNSALQQASRTT